MLPGASLSMRCFATATAYRYVPSTFTPYSSVSSTPVKHVGYATYPELLHAVVRV